MSLNSINLSYGALSGSLIPGTSLPAVDLHHVEGRHAEMISEWIAHRRTKKWLDLGNGRQEMGARELLLMLIGQRCYARLFTLPGSTEYLGLVCLNDYRNEMGSAEVWGLRGSYKTKLPNVTPAAFLSIVADGFLKFNRTVINAWAVDGNELSIQMIQRLGMRAMGRQRSRHVTDGNTFDRLLFDITASEFTALYPSICATYNSPPTAQ